MFEHLSNFLYSLGAKVRCVSISFELDIGWKYSVDTKEKSRHYFCNNSSPNVSDFQWCTRIYSFVEFINKNAAKLVFLCNNMLCVFLAGTASYFTVDDLVFGVGTHILISMTALIIWLKLQVLRALINKFREIILAFVGKIQWRGNTWRAVDVLTGFEQKSAAAAVASDGGVNVFSPHCLFQNHSCQEFVFGGRNC